MLKQTSVLDVHTETTSNAEITDVSPCLKELSSVCKKTLDFIFVQQSVRDAIKFSLPLM